MMPKSKCPVHPPFAAVSPAACFHNIITTISYCLIIKLFAFVAFSFSVNCSSSCFVAAFSPPPPSSRIRIFGAKTAVSTTSSNSSSTLQRQAAAAAASVVAGSSTSSSSSSIIMMKAATFEQYSPAYKSLVQHLRTISHLNHASSVLNYDRQVFMPQSDMSSFSRGQQLATLASITHEKSIDPQIGQWISQAMQDLVSLQMNQQQHDIGETELMTAQRLLELEMQSYQKQICIPSELAARKAELEASANHAWVKARQNNDFASFAPLLKDCFDTASEIANLQRCGGVGKDANDDNQHASSTISLYSQMLDEFEMGMSSERMDSLFHEVQSVLVPFIAQVRNSSNPPSLEALSSSGKGLFPIPAQQEASRTIVTALGFDNSRGRVDVSVHPFTMTLSRHDVRITSRFNEKEWYQGLMGTIHEGGHAMYEQNLLSDSDLSIDTPLSMGVHESQSLFWERHIGKSREFYTWAQPILKNAFHTKDNKGEEEGGQGGGGEFDYSAEELYAAVNAVDFTNLIRVDADELTYPLHVILRYNIERDVIAGKLEVDDIPARWNKDMEELLGVHVPDDTRGCLQDIHWSCLAIGYFPTYLIGAMMAAQLSHYCHEDIPDMDNMIAEGKFDEIREWLRKKVHVHGKRYKSLDDLLLAEVGEPLITKYFIDYLTAKYSDLYKI